MHLSKIDEVVSNHIDELVENNPESITALMIRANQRIEFPEFEGSPEDQQMAKYLYYKSHYFDHIDVQHPAIYKLLFLTKDLIITYLN